MYQLRSPHPALERYIEHYWFVRAEPAQPFDLTVDVYVDARADLVLNFGVPYARTVLGHATTMHAASNLDAQRLKPIRIAQRGHVVLAGVRFRTGGLAPFVRRPVHVWNDQVVPVESVFDGELEPAVRHLDVDRQAQVLDAYFLARAQVTPAMEEFYALKARIENGAFRMDELPVPGRRLHRLFKAHLGFAPKTFARVVRFQRALARLRNDPGCTLAQVAVECGYSDQPHFVREHRLFAGVPPREQVGYYPAGAPTDFSPNLVRFVQEPQRQ